MRGGKKKKKEKKKRGDGSVGADQPCLRSSTLTSPILLSDPTFSVRESGKGRGEKEKGETTRKKEKKRKG